MAAEGDAIWFHGRHRGTVAPPPSHPGARGYVDLFAKAFTPRTKVLAVTYVSGSSGDMLPVAELCALA
jgi:selenocysteine lyase/cysteine desulfurase